MITLTSPYFPRSSGAGGGTLTEVRGKDDRVEVEAVDLNESGVVKSYSTYTATPFVLFRMPQKQ